MASKERFLKLDLQPQDMAFYFNESKKMLLNWLHSYLKHKIYQYPKPATEVMLFSKPDRLCGRVDAIYKLNLKPILFEFKTNKYNIIDDNLKFQLGFYVWLYESNFNERPLIAVQFLNSEDGLRFLSVSNKLLAKTKRKVKELQHTLATLNKPDDFPCKCRINKACERDFYM